jgi:hypothetical protein
MRRIALVLTLFVAACATKPQQPQAQLPAPPQQTSSEPRRLLGLTAAELVGHFGNPAFQVREGNSLKLQFRSMRCVLDAYLYPSGTSGPLRVTHVDARDPTGADTDQAACISALERAS